jgi:TrpR-related protein YerC/YecD
VFYYAKVATMKKSQIVAWKTETGRQLVTALANISDASEMEQFLGDILTEKEILTLCSRFEAAILLSQGRTYADVIEQTKLSSRTVARINDWMKNGYGGYETAIRAIDERLQMLSTIS